MDEIVGRVINGKQSQSIEFNGEVVLDHCGESSKSIKEGSSKALKKSSLSSCRELRMYKEERDSALKQVGCLFFSKTI